MYTVEQIHNEIDTAQDRLLHEASENIKKINLSTEQENAAIRLKKLGFTGTAIVVESEEKIKEKNALLAESKLIEYYKNAYPFLKFLTVSEFDRICEKYDLIYAEVSRYTRDVPEKNISEIENAQPRFNKDEISVMYKYRFDYFSYVPNEVRSWMEKTEFLDKMHSDAQFRNACPIKYAGAHLYKSAGLTQITIDKRGLFIAAPKSHFNLDGADRDGTGRGFFNFKKEKIEPKDPIVFRYVNGGIQILTKWGKEAEDEALVNPINN